MTFITGVIFIFLFLISIASLSIVVYLSLISRRQTNSLMMSGHLDKLITYSIIGYLTVMVIVFGCYVYSFIF